MFGLMICIVVVIHYLFDVKKITIPSILHQSILLLSEFSLTIYVLHHAFILYVSHPIHQLIFSDAGSVTYLLALYLENVIFIALMIICCHYWKIKKGGYLSLEWLITR